VTQIELGNAIDFYGKWPTPIAIISDGPYGLSSYPGDLKEPQRLADWYEPHIEKWSKYSTPLPRAYVSIFPVKQRVNSSLLPRRLTRFSSRAQTQAGT